MMLHIGDNKIIAQQDILLIMPAEGEHRQKSRILLADGSELFSPIASTTLRKRLLSQQFSLINIDTSKR